MAFRDPFKVYTAAGNLECQLIVELLTANGIQAIAELDDTLVSLWSGLGTISQNHQPSIWVDKSQAEDARELIRQFEQSNRERENPAGSELPIEVECEECGAVNSFPQNLKGTTQDCPECGAYLDVGPMEWGEEELKS